MRIEIDRECDELHNDNTPEKSLWSAVLVQALYIASGRTIVRDWCDETRIRQYKNDLHWLMDRDSDYVGSVSWICHNIGVDYDAMLKVWESKKEKIRRHGERILLEIVPYSKTGRPVHHDKRQTALPLWEREEE
jgi:hypothetical protein